MSLVQKEYQPMEVAILKQASASLKNGGAANKNNKFQLAKYQMQIQLYTNCESDHFPKYNSVKRCKTNQRYKSRD